MVFISIKFVLLHPELFNVLNKMTSRRLIRIKVLQLLYSYTKKDGATINEIEKELFKSINKTTELYYHVFLLLTDIQRRAFLKIDAARNKLLATPEDLNPNTRFIENPVIRQIAHNRKFKTYVSTNYVSFNDTPELINILYDKLTGLDFFKAYMEQPSVDYEAHKQLVLDIISNLFADDEDLDEALENKNIFWNDDLEFVLSIAYKTVKRMKREFNEDTVFFLSLYNEEEDFDLAKTLYRRSVLDMHPNMDLINQYTNNWDLDRISDIDKLVMDIAISELRYFPSIPVKVTLNEYIDISKNYGTEKSGGFINGILDKIVSELQEKGEINKMGRGLMD